MSGGHGHGYQFRKGTISYYISKTVLFTVVCIFIGSILVVAWPVAIPLLIIVYIIELWKGKAK